MATTGVAAFGTTISPTAGEISGVSGPGIAVEDVDITHHESADAFKEFAAGLIDGGEFSIEGNLTSGLAAGLYADLISRTAQSYVITFPNSMTWTFSGYPKAFDTDAPVDGKLGFSATFKVTGKPVLAGS